jgi:hypothetical protein
MGEPGFVCDTPRARHNETGAAEDQLERTNRWWEGCATARAVIQGWRACGEVPSLSRTIFRRALSCRDQTRASASANRAEHYITSASQPTPPSSRPARDRNTLEEVLSAATTNPNLRPDARKGLTSRGRLTSRVWFSRRLGGALGLTPEAVTNTARKRPQTWDPGSASTRYQGLSGSLLGRACCARLYYSFKC